MYTKSIKVTMDFNKWTSATIGMVSSQYDLFTMANGYINLGVNRVNEQAGAVGEVEVWSKPWKLNVPAKVKNFGWRVLHGLLPCRDILANRHIENSGSCPTCNEGCEDIKHLLFLCKRAHDIWQKISRCLAWNSEVYSSGSIEISSGGGDNKQIEITGFFEQLGFGWIDSNM